MRAWRALAGSVVQVESTILACGLPPNYRVLQPGTLPTVCQIVPAAEAGSVTPPQPPPVWRASRAIATFEVPFPGVGS